MIKDQDQDVLQLSILHIKGVGPKKAEKLNRMGLNTIENVLYAFPREYEDRRNIKKIAEIKEGEQALIVAKVILIKKSKYAKNKKRILRILVNDDTGSLELVFFNAAYYEKTFKVDEKYYFYGRVGTSLGKLQIVHPDFSEADSNKRLSILPIYPLTEGINQKERRKIQQESFKYLDYIEEYLPDDTIQRNRLCGIKYALKAIHFPVTFQSIKESKYRLVFEEFLLLQTGLLAIKNYIYKEQYSIVFSKDKKIDAFIHQLSFKLTNAQYRVINEILSDMESNKIMNRLIQGDVGSGKTVVAAAAIYKAAICSYQSVLMAPTEILAKQHFDTFKEFFKKLTLHIEFLSGNTSKKERIQILEDLKSGKIDLLIGTHAVIQEQVNFNRLGLVITDEQHRFGVNQRAALVSKGENPDVLVMTATPIPRTLALILYGDLDISIIDEMPPGRKKISTFCMDESKRHLAYDFVIKEIEKGRQAYIVAPLIEDSEALDLRSTQSIYEELKILFSNCQIALLHGNMNQKEKDNIMKSYLEGETQILISTVVIEVGINVPNASVMVIENCERFGLAQLHQLRGRVGRGSHPSYCILIGSGKSKIAKERARIMEQTNDGFVIAEKDLNIRGPGEFFGTKQHGIPELKIANIFKHIKILKQAQDEAKLILQEDPLLNTYKNLKMKEKIINMFKQLDNFSL